MALKSNNIVHIEKAKLLKQMRIDSGLTQEQLGTRLGLSRYTISAIENCHAQQIETIEADVEDKWWKVCKPMVRTETKQNWFDFVVSKLGL